MKPHLYIAAVLFFVSLYAQAQNQEKKARIKYLFSLMKQDSLVLKQMDASINAYKNLSSSMMDTTLVKLDSAMIQRRDVFIRKITDITKTNTLKLLNEDMVDVYDQYFTAEEIEAFCVFYQTPAGKKMVSSTPAITKEVMTRSMTKYQPELMKLIKEFMDESKREIDLKFKK